MSYFLHLNENKVCLKELKGGIISYIRIWEDTIGGEDSPIVTEEWKNKVYWKRVINSFDES